MTPEDRLKNYPRHPSQRGEFAFELYKQMVKNKNIYLVVGDLGYGMFDPHFADFPEQCFNVGAAEQAMVGICVGLALEGKIALAYSVTNFILYRPYETIRNYLNAERIPVKLLASGRDCDYQYDGFSHQSPDAHHVLENFPNLCQYWPETKEEIASMTREFLYNDRPCFVSLCKK